MAPIILIAITALSLSLSLPLLLLLQMSAIYATRLSQVFPRAYIYASAAPLSRVDSSSRSKRFLCEILLLLPEYSWPWYSFRSIESVATVSMVMSSGNRSVFREEVKRGETRENERRHEGRGDRRASAAIR